jgi:hypothetical protein
MALSAPTVRTHLSADALLGLLRTGFANIAELCHVLAEIALSALL